MHLLKLILLFSLCIWMSANAQTPYDSFAPETSRPILTSEALSKEKCAQDFSSDTTLLVAMIDRQQERILLVDMSNGSIVAYAPLTDNKCHWLSVDPLADKYPYISPYAYCNWNPVKNIDPDGKWVETVWDIANIGMDIASLKSNISAGNVGGAILDGLGLALDVGATLLPGIPGGAGTAIKASRTADKVSGLGKSGNAINGVSPNNPNAEKYINAAKTEFGEL